MKEASGIILTILILIWSVSAYSYHLSGFILLRTLSKEIQAQRISPSRLISKYQFSTNFILFGAVIGFFGGWIGAHFCLFLFFIFPKMGSGPLFFKMNHMAIAILWIHTVIIAFLAASIRPESVKRMVLDTPNRLLGLKSYEVTCHPKWKQIVLFTFPVWAVGVSVTFLLIIFIIWKIYEFICHHSLF